MILGSIILAGGRSRRMGHPKESLPIAGTTLLGRTVDTLLRCTFPVVVVARDEEQALPPFALEAELVFDGEKHQGPLVGLLSGLRFAAGECDAVFVTGCDAPFLTCDAVAFLADRLLDHDVVMPRVAGKLQPLCAIYRTTLLPRIEALVASNVHTPRTLAEEDNVRILEQPEVDAFDAEHRFLQNLNHPDDYKAAVAKIGTEPGTVR